MGDDHIGDFAVDLGDWCEEHADQIKADFDTYFAGFNGRHFERFSGMGSADPDRFAATDILAVEALSVGVPPAPFFSMIWTVAAMIVSYGAVLISGMSGTTAPTVLLMTAPVIACPWRT